MNILLRKVFIAHPASSHHQSVKDILLVNGIIQQIANHINADADIIIEEEGLTTTAGWIDIFSHFNDPGHEYKETLQTGAAAAAAGGFTQVFTLPNTKPVVDNKSQVEYVVQKSKDLPVTLHPLGAITKGTDGKDLAEMYDMQHSGAIAFSDGTSPVQSPGLFLKALQYIKAFDGILIQIPTDKSIGQYGLINEGIVSTRLGLPGIPAIAEEIIILRDIELLKYTNSKLHITGVSTAKGIALIQQAKEAGLAVTCSVTPYHLYFSDEDLQTYDTNLKVNPPLRPAEDVQALREAVLNGWVDSIASHHLPQDWDNKTCEFEYAKYGMLGLQTSYAAVQTVLPQLTAEQVSRLFSANARSIFNIPDVTIEEGAVAELSLFSPKQHTSLTTDNNRSKSFNTAFAGKTLNGKVIGIIHKGNLYLNK